MMRNDIPRPEHPNPQWERKSWKNLNGTWEFELDAVGSGEDRELYLADRFSSEITVPFCPESELSGVGNKDFMLCVWYAKTLTFTEDELASKRVLLHFGAADFETKIWVNQTPVGLPHVGGFGSFEYDVTPFVKPGNNRLVVRCYDDSRDTRQPLGK